MNCCEYFKSPTTELPMKAKQAVALADAAYQRIYEDSVQDNLTRWKENAINAINASANRGNYNTFIWIYKSPSYDETDTFGLGDFCAWLSTFGYKVTTNDMKIRIDWEDAR